MTSREPPSPKKPPLYLQRLRLKNIRCFEDAEIQFTREGSPFRPMTLIVGENSAGKTTLLRALVLALMDSPGVHALLGDLTAPMVRDRESTSGSSPRVDAQIDLELVDADGGQIVSIKLEMLGNAVSRRYRRWAPGVSLDRWTSPGQNGVESNFFVCGYGVGRAYRGKGSQERHDAFEAVRTLFRDDAQLLDPEKVLLQARLAELEGGPSAGTLAMFRRFIQALTPITETQVGQRGVAVGGPWGTPVPLQALGDGYRGTVTWLLDYLARAEMAGAMTPEGPAGIVLLDEIDEHLHPLWRRRLVGLLREHFPRTQFIGTTHSAITLLNCEPDEIVACKLRDGVATVTQDLPPSQGRSVQELLSGEWFGLEAVVDDVTMAAMRDYREAVAQGAPEETVAPLRRRVRDRLGVPPATLMDELAIRAAALVRSEQERSGRAPESMVQEAAARLRAMLKDGKPS